MPSKPASAAPTRDNGRRALGVRRSDISLILALTALLALTVWQARRSDAMEEALAASEGRPSAVTLHTLLEASRKAWSDGEWNKRAGSVSRRPEIEVSLRRALDHLDRFPRDPRAARLAALALTSLDFAVEAEPYYKIAREGKVLSREDLSNRALGLARGNLREFAIASYEELLASQPDDAAMLQRLATLYYSQKRLKLAMETAEKLAKAPDGAVPGYALIGIIHHDDHRTEAAAAANEKVLELDPELRTLALPSSLFYADFAQDLIDLDRPADASRHLQRALKQGEDPTLLNLLGVAFEREGKSDQAVASWKRAIELDPNASRPWLNLGLRALEAGRLDEAIADLERATLLDGASLEPSYQLSLAYRRAGRIADADRYRKKADRIRTQEIPPLHNRKPTDPAP